MNKKLIVDSDKLDAVVAMLIYALTTDGAHHKQYYVEEALILLTGNKWVEDAKKEFQWEKGIPA